MAGDLASLQDFSAIAASPTEPRLAAGRRGGEIVLVAFSSGQAVRSASLAAHTKAITELAFSQDGRMLASGDRDGQIVVWDLAAGGQRRWQGRLPNSDPFGVTNLIFDAAGRTLVATGPESMRFWDLPSNQTTLDFNTGSFIGAPLVAALHAEGKLLAWGTGSQHEIEFMPMRAGRGFGPPLRYVTGGNWSEVPVPLSLAFNGANTALAVAYNDGTVMLWDFDVDSWKAEACRIANRALTPGEWQQYMGDAGYAEVCPAGQ
jgi:WD40 repeat protein